MLRFIQRFLSRPERIRVYPPIEIPDLFWVLGPDGQPVDVAQSHHEALRVMTALQHESGLKHTITVAS